MANPNEYLVFEADQVLTNDHLNQLFYYVDQQNRWTRNKLIGIGIACGLNLVQLPGVIQVTKGCGVTSQGYLILHDTTNYTYYIPYAAIDQPNDLPFTYPTALPFYKPYCTGKTVFLLLSDDEYNALEADKQKLAKTISSSPAKQLDDFVVVLFLEATELDLKNCDAFDCNNKGEKIQFQVRALLVKKTELPGVTKEKGGKTTGTAPAKLTAPEIDFKRFNVPYKDLQSADDILNAFIQIVDDNTLSTLTNAYIFCYERYKFLFNTTSNPFTGLLNDLKKFRDTVVKTNPVFIQYFYDFIDDLIKAYYEFRVKAYELISSCCPDENMFPLHLVLGDATANTIAFEKDNYRQYFIYSPLFERQGNEASEIVFLFMRMQILVKEFKILSQKSIKELDIRITPSQYESHPLSKRAIPYYYNVNDPANQLYKFWSYSKTSHGNAAFNLGYNSNLYNGASGVIHPLLYDIEYYNFFRIEGHIGLNYSACLSNILQQRQTYNLPFDVVAVSTEQLQLGTDTPPECNIQDLEADYKLIVSEFACKVHVPFCFFSQSPYEDATRLGNNSAGSDNGMPSFATVKTEAVQNFNDAVIFEKAGYVKGDFLRKYCPPKAKTVASAYIAAIGADGTFTNPLSPNQKNPLLTSYYYTFEFIDAVEGLMKVLLTSSTATLDIAALKATYMRYLATITALTNVLAFFNEDAATKTDAKAAEWILQYDLDLLLLEFGVLTSVCIDERLQTLKEEYKRRWQLYELQRSFLYYYKKHPGLEHKAGVPKGGTFVLVYNPANKRRVPGTSTASTNAASQSTTGVAVSASKQTAVAATTVQVQPAQINQAYYDESTIQLFRSFVEDCNDAPIEKKTLILNILLNTQIKSPVYQIPDDAIVADFYVPYLCCSDCPPVAYILAKEPAPPTPEPPTPEPPDPQPPKEKPTLKMQNQFCDNDKNPAKIEVSQSGGTFSDDKGNKIKGLDEAIPAFIPIVAGAGTFTIIYTLNGLASDPVVVTVLKTPANSNFSFTSKQQADRSFLVTFTPAVTDSSFSFQWAFGPGFKPSESKDMVPSVVATINPTGATIQTSAALTVTNGACAPGGTKTDLQITPNGVFTFKP